MTILRTSLEVDAPVVLAANYQLNGPDRREIDNQIRAIEQCLVEGLIKGCLATWYVLSPASAAVIPGDTVAVCPDDVTGRTVTKSTSGTLGTAGIPAGMVLLSGTPGALVLVMLEGIVPKTITGLAAGTSGFVRVNLTTSRAEYVVSLTLGDYPLGFVDTAGNLTLCRGIAMASAGESFPVGGTNQVFANLGAGPVWSGAPVVTSLTATGFVGVGSSLPSTGAVRLPNDEFIYSRTAAGTNASLIGITSTDIVRVGSSAGALLLVSSGSATLNASTIALAHPTLANGDIAVNRADTTEAAAGDTTILAQSSTHASGVGGDLVLGGGEGATNGNVKLYAGANYRLGTTDAGTHRENGSDPTSHPTTGADEWITDGGYARRTSGKLTTGESDLETGSGSPSAAALCCDYTYRRKVRSVAPGTLYETWEIGTIRGIQYLNAQHATIRIDVDLMAQSTELGTGTARQYGAASRSRSYQYDAVTGLLTDIAMSTVVDLYDNDPSLSFASSLDTHSIRTSVSHAASGGAEEWVIDWFYEVRVRIWAPNGAAA